MDYDKLIMNLREAPDDWYDRDLHFEAANAIESLYKELQNCRDELCLKCGSYSLAHLGACDHCRYKDI